MANSIQSRTLVGGGPSKVLVLHRQITSDGTEELNTVIYNNSAFVNNVLKGNLVEIYAMGADCQLTFSWDQTTASKAISVNPVNSPYICLKDIGGIPNPGATGATGNLLLSTANLDAGDEVTVILTIWQN